LKHIVFLLLSFPFCLNSSLFCIYSTLLLPSFSFSFPLSSFFLFYLHLFLFSFSYFFLRWHWLIFLGGRGGGYFPIYRPLSDNIKVIIQSDDIIKCYPEIIIQADYRS
jgi:hypothetical protein